jgi:hypothetical protein
MAGLPACLSLAPRRRPHYFWQNRSSLLQAAATCIIFAKKKNYLTGTCTPTTLILVMKSTKFVDMYEFELYLFPKENAKKGKRLLCSNSNRNFHCRPKAHR